jgi:thiamine pyrophosphate-dependent acetolactate synthase large subunit-like protein
LPRPGQTLIQIDAAEDVIGQNHRPDLALVSDVKLALTAALAHPAPAPNPNRQGWSDEYRAVQEVWATNQRLLRLPTGRA